MANWVRAVTPRSMVMDLLRVASPSPVSVRALIEAGVLFGLEANAIRVAVTRLASRGLLEPARRGWYRLAGVAHPLHELVEEWRLGERRMVAWAGDWLAVLPAVAGRSDAARSEHALGRLGFVCGLGPLWMRPHNLATGVDGTRRRLHELGLGTTAELFVAGQLSEATRQSLATAWPVADLHARLEAATSDLQQSLARLDTLSPEQALVETFMLGGAAIRWLSADPLLPEELASSEPRRALTTAMLRYDRAGRELWREAIDRAKLTGAPSHLGALVDRRVA